jgi:hypothetical protein
MMEVAVSNLPVVGNNFICCITNTICKHIDWNDRFENFKPGNCAAVTVDCTDFHVLETYPFEKGLWLFNRPGLRYEIGVCIATGLIVWLNGPYLPQQMNDLSIFQHRMMWALTDGEWIVGDQGYHDGDSLSSQNNLDLNGFVT